MIYDNARGIIRELVTLERPFFNPVGLLVVGCSSSEIAGGVIGHQSTYPLGEALADATLDLARERGFECAFQCCEHLNRALVVERRVAEKYGLEPVCVVPYPKAGGSVASAAYRMMDEPVVVESLQADAGIDIGDTLIGMHLKPVAVPVRLAANLVGEARVVAARTRAKLIGGERAKYNL